MRPLVVAPVCVRLLCPRSHAGIVNVAGQVLPERISVSCTLRLRCVWLDEQAVSGEWPSAETEVIHQCPG